MTATNTRRDTNGNDSPDSFRSIDRMRSAAALLGASGVGLGAWGSHGLKNRPIFGTTTPTARLENWKTAVSYQLIHAVTILSISILCETLRLKDQQLESNLLVRQDEERSRLVTSDPSKVPKREIFPIVRWYERAGHCMVWGSVMFSGSIYMLCLDSGPKKLWGPVTPLGGLCLMAGWAILFTTSATRSGTWRDNKGD